MQSAIIASAFERLGMTARSREIRPTAANHRQRHARSRQANATAVSSVPGNTGREARNAGLILRPSRRKRTYNRIEIRSAPVHTHAVRKCGAHAIPAIRRERSMTFRACCASRRRFMGLRRLSRVDLGTAERIKIYAAL